MIGILLALLFSGLIIFWGVKYNFALPFNIGGGGDDPQGGDGGDRDSPTQAYNRKITTDVTTNNEEYTYVNIPNKKPTSMSNLKNKSILSFTQKEGIDNNTGVRIYRQGDIIRAMSNAYNSSNLLTFCENTCSDIDECGGLWYVGNQPYRTVCQSFLGYTQTGCESDGKITVVPDYDCYMLKDDFQDSLEDLSIPGLDDDGNFVNPNDSSMKGDFKLLKKLAA